MKRYVVSASCTISLHTEVEARTKKEALAIVDAERNLPNIRDDSDSKVEWSTSGEIDGEPFDIEISEATP